jgi:hypothetical protein
MSVATASADELAVDAAVFGVGLALALAVGCLATVIASAARVVLAGAVSLAGVAACWRGVRLHPTNNSVGSSTLGVMCFSFIHLLRYGARLRPLTITTRATHARVDGPDARCAVALAPTLAVRLQ